MTELRYTMEFDGRVVAADMDLQTALILVEAFAEKFCEDMERGVRIVLYCENAKLYAIKCADRRD